MDDLQKLLELSGSVSGDSIVKEFIATFDLVGEGSGPALGSLEYLRDQLTVAIDQLYRSREAY